MSKKNLIQRAIDHNRSERARLDEEYKQLGLELLALVVDEWDDDDNEGQEAG